MNVEKKVNIYHIRQVLYYFAVILAGAQILIGLVWILCNISKGCAHEKTAIYLNAAASGVMDDYTGILYPWLIRIVQLIAGLFGIAYEPVIYFIQLAVAVIGCTVFWKLSCYSHGCDGWKRPKAWYRGLVLVTIPLCVQWHLTILPNTLTASFFMMLLGHVIYLYRFRCYEDKKWMIRIAILWAVMIMLMPEYLYLALPPVLLSVWGSIRHQKMNDGKKRLNGITVLMVLLPFCLALIVTGMNRAIQQPGSTGRIQNSLQASMVSRFVWPHFGSNYFFWSDEIKAVMTEEEGAQIAVYADLVQTEFGPMVEEAYGREMANSYYRQMALSCLKYRTREVMTALGEDFAAYLNPLWMVREQLSGYGLSNSGYLYDKMRENAPEITKVYVGFGLLAFRVALLLASVCVGCDCILWQKHKKNRANALLVILVGCVLLQALWYTMSGAGVMQYGNVCVIQMLWYCGIMKLTEAEGMLIE